MVHEDCCARQRRAEEHDLKSFNTLMISIIAATNINFVYDDMKNIILTKMSEF